MPRFKTALSFKIDRGPFTSSKNGPVTIIVKGDTIVNKGNPPPLLLFKEQKATTYGEDWTKELRKRIRRRDKYACRICFYITRARDLDIHHINYDKGDCSELNLITLCIACHKRTNYHRRQWYDVLWHKMNDVLVSPR